MSNEPTSHLVHEIYNPVQEIALNNAPLVEDEDGMGLFTPETLHVRWARQEQDWTATYIAVEGTLVKPFQSSLNPRTRGDRRYRVTPPHWLYLIIGAHRPAEPGR